MIGPAMITQRASLLAFVGFCFYLIAIVNSLPVFYDTLTWFALAFLISSFITARLSIAGLGCLWKASRDCSAQRAGQEEMDSGPQVRIDLSNRGPLNKCAVNLEVRLRHFETGKLVPQCFQIQSLPKGTSLDCTLTLAGLAPGHYRIEEVHLLSTDPLGLFRCKRRLLAASDRLPEEIVVER